ncbi:MULTISPECIES: DUF397 domain-containing protein [unclassified Streptomyces]|uniref:DUF397 domain-containing protein n=1 Tax=unclassified Streptomyces TaxID=2593676 RepID=UPI00331BCF66
MASTEITGWYKSSYSGGETPQGECLEVAPSRPDVPVRDSKTPDSPILLLSPPCWTAFVTALKAGHLTAASCS